MASFSPLSLILLAAACQGGIPDDTAADTAEDTGPAPPSGTFVVSIEHDGLEREAVVYVPASYDPGTSTPLVLNFHGFGGLAEYHLEEADLRPQADRTGGLLVVPQGSLLDGSSHWNPALPGGDNKSSADDFGFVAALLEAVREQYPYDAGRVSAVGYSNGGMMALGLACQRSELIASAGSVSGAMLDESCDLAHPLSIITLHGTADSVIPYDGSGDYQAAMDVVNYWRGANNTGDASPVSLSGNLDYWAYEAGDSGTAVHHYRVTGGDHVWYGFTADGASANDRIWDFLTSFSVEGRL